MAFVDVRMPPGWDGVNTVSHLWQADGLLQVVLCTAYADFDWQGVVSRLGASDGLLVLKKPFDNIEVLQLAHALTRKWAVQRELRSTLANLAALVGARTVDLENANRELRDRKSVV